MLHTVQKNIIRFGSTICMFLFLTLSAYGKLTWEWTEQRKAQESGQALIEYEYPFTNSGDKTITITKIESSCGCTVPALEKKVYEPGESGTVKASFKTTGRNGLQHKRIVVYTDDAKNPEVILRLEALLKEPFAVYPRLIMWEKGKENKTQIARVHTPNENEPITIREMQLSHPNFEAEVKEVKDGSDLEIQITPVSTDKVMTASLTVDMMPHARSKIYLLVR